jgi:glycosyltransferase involved in cell wall biosynthesis
VPVITTDVADLKELIDKETGIVLPVADTFALASAMKTMQENHRHYNPVILRSKVKDICSIDSVSGMLDQIYQPLIK